MKKNVIYICGVIGIVLICVLIGILVFNKNININPNGNHNISIGGNELKDVEIETETRIAHDYKNKNSNVLDKDFTIKHSETGKFSIYMEPEEGSIFINIIDANDEEVININENTELENNTISVDIDEGQGIYKLRVLTNNFKGKFDVSLETESTAKIEEYISAVGYKTKYNSTMFSVEKINNGERYSVKNNSGKVKNYFDITVTPKENAEAVKANKFEEDMQKGPCYIGPKDNMLKGEYAKKEIQMDETNETVIIYCMFLEDGRLLTVEQHVETESQYLQELNGVLEFLTVSKD